MRNSTLILFGLLLVLLAVSSVDGASIQRKHHSHKKGKDAKRKPEVEKRPQERELLERASTNNKYHHYYEGSQGGDSTVHGTQRHEVKPSKGFDETKARLAADAELNKKPQTYLESIGGGQGGGKEVQQKLVKQRIQKGLKYH